MNKLASTMSNGTKEDMASVVEKAECVIYQLNHYLQDKCDQNQ